MTPKLSGPMLPPAAGGMPRQLVVLLHGYGADGNDLIDLGRHWAGLLPEALFVAPNAPEPCAGNPFGFQWFALALDRTISRVSGVPGASGVLANFLGELWAQTGLAARDTVLVGFSQGAMMALHVGLALAEPPAGIVSFSGALVPPEGLGQGALPPVCLVHGDADQVVDPGLSATAAQTLRAAGATVGYHVSQGTGHGISPDGLAFATAFLKECFDAARS